MADQLLETIQQNQISRVNFATKNRGSKTNQMAQFPLNNTSSNLMAQILNVNLSLLRGTCYWRFQEMNVIEIFDTD